jgi:hypothetical protein
LFSRKTPLKELFPHFQIEFQRNPIAVLKQENINVMERRRAYEICFVVAHDHPGIRAADKAATIPNF